MGIVQDIAVTLDLANRPADLVQFVVIQDGDDAAIVQCDPPGHWAGTHRPEPAGRTGARCRPVSWSIRRAPAPRRDGPATPPTAAAKGAAPPRAPWWRRWLTDGRPVARPALPAGSAAPSSPGSGPGRLLVPAPPLRERRRRQRVLSPPPAAQPAERTAEDRHRRHGGDAG